MNRIWSCGPLTSCNCWRKLRCVGLAIRSIVWSLRRVWGWWWLAFLIKLWSFWIIIFKFWRIVRMRGWIVRLRVFIQKLEKLLMLGCFMKPQAINISMLLRLKVGIRFFNFFFKTKSNCHCEFNFYKRNLIDEEKKKN